MPTGYTATLMESGQTFEEFVLQCARAFGACAEMRDEPFDKPIPEEFKPSDYSVKALEAAKLELARLESMSVAERAAYGVECRAKATASATKYLAQAVQENARLEAMEALVNKWNPPTNHHFELKDFMLQQIGVSKNKLTYSADSLRAAQEKLPSDFYNDAVKAAQRDIEYHAKSSREEIDRAKSRTEWVKQLRDSLK